MSPLDRADLALVFTSGNFGSPDIFVKALHHSGYAPAERAEPATLETTL
jgi:hypothetical protein